MFLFVSHVAVYFYPELYRRWHSKYLSGTYADQTRQIAAAQLKGGGEIALTSLELPKCVVCAYLSQNYHFPSLLCALIYSEATSCELFFL